MAKESSMVFASNPKLLRWLGGIGNIVPLVVFVIKAIRVIFYLTRKALKAWHNATEQSQCLSKWLIYFIF